MKTLTKAEVDQEALIWCELGIKPHVATEMISTYYCLHDALREALKLINGDPYWFGADSKEVHKCREEI